jgi:hypothetical protein
MNGGWRVMVLGLALGKALESLMDAAEENPKSNQGVARS